ncbi:MULTISPECIES: cupin domain-containing protein [Novosphingobium]|uniref:Cupin type-2 domain-containing protein n=2 Tax=Novosphingobium TaxID=165696 RepID=A0ABQ2K5R6_9SPHN|nr:MULTISPECIES: cupin domain-containing protein [Novosphingobium]MCT2401984.1 cupin domain-containing protein [Novosphingobium mangrovi (ex Huang et al. 2023)]GGN63050.1 hypothetical protein GCM10011349_47280 [Novosphingobium indicum]
MKIAEGYPDLIKSKLPAITHHVSGFAGYLLQGEHSQLVFSDFTGDFNAPDHVHGHHLGIVLEGEVEMTIEGETRIYGPGEYYIVAPGAVHSAKIEKGTKSIDIWFEPDHIRLKD